MLGYVTRRLVFDGLMSFGIGLGAQRWLATLVHDVSRDGAGSKVSCKAEITKKSLRLLTGPTRVD